MDNSEFLLKLGASIARIRKENKVSQRDLGLQIDMENTNLSAIENGRQNPSALTLKKIADALECSVADFFN